MPDLSLIGLRQVWNSCFESMAITNERGDVLANAYREVPSAKHRFATCICQISKNVKIPDNKHYRAD